jgi:Ala-tRNA(Pro) deacylase
LAKLRITSSWLLANENGLAADGAVERKKLLYNRLICPGMFLAHLGYRILCVAKNSSRKEHVMAILKKLKALLDEAKIPYEVYNHALAYTAQEIAAKQHFSGNEMAKVVMIEADDRLVMGVVRGNDKVNTHLVEESLAVRKARLATEDEFIARFPECEIGAMPPFGNLFGLKVYVDPALAKDEYIFFNAGNHVQTVHMKYQDFAKLVQPEVVRLVGERSKFAA